MKMKTQTYMSNIENSTNLISKNNSILKSRLTIFFVEAICMILELCSSYLLYPYFGNSNAIWISIITVILLSNCLGNILGGYLCNKSNKNYTGTIFFLTSAFITFILGFNEVVVSIIQKLPFENNINTLICSLVLFLPAELLLGTIPPQVMYKETTEDNYNAEKTGLVYALSTMGGLFGTVFGGFILVPYIGCKYIIIICAIMVLIFAFVYEHKFYKKTTCVISLITIIGIIFSSIAYKEENWLNKDFSSYKVDSQYNRIIIRNRIENGEKIRDMIMASGYESATYLDEDKRNELIFEYLKDLNITFYENELINSDKSLMIGGAAYQFPKYLLSHYHNKSIDVIELDKTVTELAKKYFFLQDCIDEFDPELKRLGLYNDDGREFLKKSNNKYNLIINDAFSGKSPIATLSSVEFMKIVKSRLESDGIYIMNIISTKSGNSKRFLLSEAKTLSTIFKNVYIIDCRPDLEDEKERNLILIGTDNTYDFKDTVNLDFSQGIVLTDDYCPVDYLTNS